MKEKEQNYYYAGFTKYGRCSYGSLNGTAWTFYRFKTEEARDAFVEDKNYDRDPDYYAKALDKDDLADVFYEIGNSISMIHVDL